MKKSILFLLPALLTAIIIESCSSSKASASKNPGEHRLAFYNVENLFDLEDDPLTLDEEFTPSGKLQWTPERYQTKLDHLAQVVEGMGFPALLGLAEVENAKVLEDFRGKTVLKNQDYGIVHYDSPDLRGIDVALLFRKSIFKVLTSETIRIEYTPELLAERPNDKTRDILFVQGIFQKKDTLNVLIAHAPSRSGGQTETEPKRIFVARQIRKKADELFKRNPAANIVIMGDLNDEPTDPSVATALSAKGLAGPSAKSTLYDCFYQLDAAGKGSYRYRGNWNMLDHIILSGNLLDPVSRLYFSKPQIFQQDWMMYEDATYGKSPNRTYGGARYFGGYSDHLPIFME